MQNLYNDIKTAMNRIESKWLKCNYSTDEFPEIVWECTQGLDLSELGTVQNQLKLLDLPEVRVQQQPSTFSDLYFQIFNNGRFMIEILNWWGGHVNVHDHDFSAVQFQLKGDALNVMYKFEETESAGALRFGELSVHKSEIWREGGRSIVRPGNATPHSVFHIGEPTTSLLIRTLPTPRYGAQSNYFPTLAAHYYVSNTIQRKKLTGLGLLSRNSPAEFNTTLNHFLNTQSLSENFFMMVKLGPLLFQERNVETISRFAERGERETKIIESVAINNGIDYLKTIANETEGVTAAEKLAIFGASAANNIKNLERVFGGLDAPTGFRGFEKELNSFMLRLKTDDMQKTKQYLEIFEMSKYINE